VPERQLLLPVIVFGPGVLAFGLMLVGGAISLYGCVRVIAIYARLLRTRGSGTQDRQGRALARLETAYRVSVIAVATFAGLTLLFAGTALASFTSWWWVLVAMAGILGATSNALLFRRQLARLRARNP
jgi:hypothetical protein